MAEVMKLLHLSLREGVGRSGFPSTTYCCKSGAGGGRSGNSPMAIRKAMTPSAQMSPAAGYMLAASSTLVSLSGRMPRSSGAMYASVPVLV